MIISFGMLQLFKEVYFLTKNYLVSIKKAHSNSAHPYFRDSLVIQEHMHLLKPIKPTASLSPPLKRNT